MGEGVKGEGGTGGSRGLYMHQGYLIVQGSCTLNKHFLWNSVNIQQAFGF
jgi:hypothetical protein